MYAARNRSLKWSFVYRSHFQAKKKNGTPEIQKTKNKKIDGGSFKF